MLKQCKLLFPICNKYGSIYMYLAILMDDYYSSRVSYAQYLLTLFIRYIYC